MSPPIHALPADKNGFLTFGCFNNNRKITPEILNLWAQILNATDKSRLILKFKGGDSPDIAENYLNQLKELAISPDRIEIYGYKPYQKHLNLYNSIDIALDTYPYNGTTTTCEALWMGVPVVSLAGDCHMSRVGLSILTRIGMEFFAAETKDEYVAKTVALAQNRQALAKNPCFYETKTIKQHPLRRKNIHPNRRI